MARLIGPDSGDRLTVRPGGSGYARSAEVVVYAASTGTTLANILTEAGAAISGSTLTTDDFGLIPLFQFPDGVDTVYVEVAGGPRTAVYARYDDRVDGVAARVAALEAGTQAIDPDLTAIAALDSSTAGALVTDGSGWIRKTYAQLKTALALVKGDVGLGNVDNTADTAKPISTATQTALDLKLSTAAASAAYKPLKIHNTPSPLGALLQLPGGRICCGADATSGKVWTYNSTALYQVDSLTATNWAAVTLPANCTTGSGGEPKIVVWTPVGGSTPLMFGVFWNTVTSRYEVYSAPLVARNVAPTWTGPLLTLSANATLIPTAIRGTSTGLFVGEYSATPAISGGPTVHRTTDATTFTAVLGPLAAARHVHGVYEDPYNLGTIYVTLGDTGIGQWVYKSTDGGATFAAVTTLASLGWQAVSMGFTADYVYFLSDQASSAGAYVCDRATMTPRWVTSATKYSLRPVPGGVGGRTVTDLVTTSGSATVTSATAAFTSADVGKYVYGPNGLPVGLYIASVTNSTTAVLSSTATASGSGLSATISGDMFFQTGYMGAVDTSTGYLYVIANDTSVGGTVGGLFVLTGRDAEWTLLYTIFDASRSTLSHYEAYIAGGYLFFGRYGPWPLLTAAATP